VKWMIPEVPKSPVDTAAETLDKTFGQDS